MKCKECNNQTVRGLHHGNYWGPWKKYCSDTCRSNARSRVLKKVNKKYRDQFDLLLSRRMKTNNPMWIPGVKEKMLKTHKRLGIKPIIRGGNGKEMPLPQRILLSALGHGWYAEHVVLTKNKKLPNCYKLDIANPKLMIAIEVDGNSHNSIKRKKQDIKKDLFLKKTGWSVYRFKNKDILNNLTNILNEII